MPRPTACLLASLLFVSSGCRGANPVEPGTSGAGGPGSGEAGSGGPATAGRTTDRGERSFGAEPLGALVVETRPSAGAPPAAPPATAPTGGGPGRPRAVGGPSGAPAGRPPEAGEPAAGEALGPPPRVVR